MLDVEKKYLGHLDGSKHENVTAAKKVAGRNSAGTVKVPPA